jgi:hypothetical protein
LVFTESGELRYIIHAEGKDQVMLLTYRIDRGTLVTNQPSDPKEERTECFFTTDGKPVLDYGGTDTLCKIAVKHRDALNCYYVKSKSPVMATPKCLSSRLFRRL